MIELNLPPGFKYNEWELRGVPLRLEIGPKDVEKGSVMAARREIFLANLGKSFLSQENLAPQVQELLRHNSGIHVTAGDRISPIRTSILRIPMMSLKKSSKMAGLKAGGVDRADCETKIKDETKATTRCMPLDQPKGEHGKCVYCGANATQKIYFSKAY